MPKKPSSEKKFNFAEQLKNLNQLVAKMEGNELPLEEALLCFEQGVALVRECQQRLKEAELKVQKLSERNGKEILEDFETEDEDEDEDDTDDDEADDESHS